MMHISKRFTVQDFLMINTKINVLCLGHFWTSDIIQSYVIIESHSQDTKVNSLDGPKDCYLTNLGIRLNIHPSFSRTTHCIWCGNKQ